MLDIFLSVSQSFVFHCLKKISLLISVPHFNWVTYALDVQVFFGFVVVFVLPFSDDKYFFLPLCRLPLCLNDGVFCLTEASFLVSCDPIY